MIALAPLDAPWQRIARAQIPEAPGTYTNPDGTIQDPVDIPPRRKKAQPKLDAPAPNPAHDTIEEFERARARASGTPEPEPTPRL